MPALAMIGAVAQMGAASAESKAESDAMTAMSIETKAHIGANDLRAATNKHAVDQMVQNSV